MLSAKGTLGPALIPERLSSNPDILFAAIKNGRPGTSMDPLGGEPALEDHEIDALVEYIMSEPSAEAFVWGEEQIMDSIEFLVDVDSLPDAPTHDGDMDNLMLVTERENRSIKVFDGTTHTDLGRIEATYRAHGYTFDPSNERWAYNLGRDGWLLKLTSIPCSRSPKLVSASILAPLPFPTTVNTSLAVTISPIRPLFLTPKPWNQSKLLPLKATSLTASLSNLALVVSTKPVLTSVAPTSC